MPQNWVHGPNLFIVGAPKCGTTSMAAYLDQHPDIYFAGRKEPFFFSVDLPHAKAVTDHQDYLDLFQGGMESRYRAEGSTWYLYSEVAARAIKDASPAAKIIVMLRDPIELIISQFQYNIINGNENLEVIEDALAAEPKRLAGDLIPDSNRIAAALHYTKMVDFAPQIERYFDHFGKERVHVIFFDDLKKDDEGTVREVFSFLDLPDDVPIDLTPENETSKLPARRFGGLYRTMITKKGLVGQAKKILPEPVKAKVWSTLDRLNKAGTNRPLKPRLGPELRESLSSALKPGIDRLASLLETDLSHWAEPEARSHPDEGHAMRA